MKLSKDRMSELVLGLRQESVSSEEREPQLRPGSGSCLQNPSWDMSPCPSGRSKAEEMDLPLWFAVSRTPLLSRVAPGPRASQDPVAGPAGGPGGAKLHTFLDFSNIALRNHLD